MTGLTFWAREELIIYRLGQRFRKMSQSDAMGGNKGYMDGWQLRRRSPPRGWQVARRRGGHVVHVRSSGVVREYSSWGPRAWSASSVTSQGELRAQHACTADDAPLQAPFTHCTLRRQERRVRFYVFIIFVFPYRTRIIEAWRAYSNNNNLHIILYR